MAKKVNFKNVTNKAIGIGVGAAAVKLSDKMLGKLNPNIRTFGQIGLGLFGPTLLKVKPNSLMDTAGDAMATVGVYKLLDKVPALSGVDDMDESIGAEYYAEDIAGEFDEDEITGVDSMDESIGQVDTEDLEEDFE